MPPRSVVVRLTRPVCGRTLQLPVGTRLVATHQDADGRWWVVWNGSTFRAVAEKV